MLASSFLDPVLGIDIHFEMVPTPAPVPLPIPNPFIGIVFDPIGLACGIALGAAIGAVVGAPFQGPVLYWTAFPATNTGTEAKHVPGHILFPPGTAWAPFPKTPKPVIHPGETPTPGLPVKPENDAVVVFGSKTVTVMGSNAVRLGDIALSCSEPLRLPSSVVLAVPKGAPILIGGPMSLDIMSAIMASLRTRFVSDSLHALVSRLKPSRFRNFLHRAVCFFTGHPVDVASGKVMTEFVDVELPGPMPLNVERIYSSAFASRPGPLGHGWSLSLDQAVWRERGKVVLLAEDGREIEFDTFDFPRHRIEPGQQVHNPIERLTLHCEDDGAWRIVDHEGTCRRFGPVKGRADGRSMLQTIVSHCGYHEIGFHYGTEGTSRGRLEWIRDSSGRFLRLIHDEHGRLTELHLPQPHGEGLYVHRRYEYGAAGDLVRVTDPLGHAWTFAYVSHLLTQETDRNGESFYFQYDGLGEDAWCVRTWGDGGIYDHTLAYDKKKKVTYVTDSCGHTTQYHMNLMGQVVKLVDPLGGETAYEYDPTTLRKTKEVDENGHETAYRYDARGNGTAVELPNGARVAFEYDEHGRMTRSTDANGGQWEHRYDSRGRLVVREASDGSRYAFTYDGAHLSAVVEPGGRWSRFTRDERGMIRQLRTSDGAITSWVHDGLGRIVTATNPGGGTIRFRYDAAGRVAEIHEPDDNVRTLTYDPEGHPVRARDANRDATFTFSSTGRLTSRTEAGTSVRFEYDTEEHLRAVVNEHGRVYGFVHDERGDVVEQVSFDGGKQTFVRGPGGRMLEQKRASGRSSRYRYDELGRIVGIEHSDGTGEQFGYRIDGMLVEATNDSATVRFERDALGRIVREWQDERWVESHFDARGYRAGIRTSFGAYQEIDRRESGETVALRYWDRAQEPSHDREAPQWEARVERDATGQELERTLPGGVRSRWSRDRLGRPVQHVLTDGATVLRDVRYEWGVDYSLRRLVDAQRGQEVSYGYDQLGNLAWVRYGEQGFDLRMPDAIGSLFRQNDRADRVYGVTGELLLAHTPKGQRRYVYDPDGNLAERHEPDGGVWRYQWSDAGRLVGVERPDGKTVELEYDALGRRVRKRFDGRTTHWVWDGNVPVHEWVSGEAPVQDEETSKQPEGTEAPLVDETGRALVGRAQRGPPPLAGTGSAPTQSPPPGLVTWIFDPDTFSPAAKIVDDERLSIITDHLGTPVAMVDTQGRMVWAVQLDAYGAVRPDDTVGDTQACPFRWPGQYEDEETGLYYNRYRYYDPEVGQYISADPLGLGGDLALYRYAPDPVTTIDPLGLMPWRWNPDTGMGHHLVPRGKANSAGMPLLGTKRNTPTFFPNPYSAGDHEAIHRAQKPHIGALQGPWDGTADELLEASRKGLDDVSHLRGDLKIPSTGEYLARNVTPAEAFDKLKEWHDAEKKKTCS